NEWLRVTMKATANSGLAAPDVFCFGNLIGDANGNGSVTVADIAMTKSLSGKSALAFAPTDFNGSAQITVADIAIAKASLGHTLAWPSAAAPLTAPAVAAPADLSITGESPEKVLSSGGDMATLTARESGRAPIYASRLAVHNEIRQRLRRQL